MNRRNARTFFSADEQERIRLAVEKTEAHTAGEIATMIVAESDRYREAELGGTMLLAALAALVVAVATHHVTIWSYLPFTALFSIPSLLLFRRFPRLKLAFCSKRRLAEAVRQRAIHAFFEKGLYRTRDETGILIFMSLLEHRVWILGDRGINEKIAPDRWQLLAVELAQGIAAGKGCDTLCAVIDKCGAELARHFRRHADDTNELTDQLFTENS